MLSDYLIDVSNEVSEYAEEEFNEFFWKEGESNWLTKISVIFVVILCYSACAGLYPIYVLSDLFEKVFKLK